MGIGEESDKLNIEKMHADINDTKIVVSQERTTLKQILNDMIKGHLDSMKTYMEMAMEDANLKWSDLSKFPIPVPPLSEQQRIVSELDLLSSIIEKKKAQLKEYDQLAQSIFYDMFGDPVTNEKGWEVKKLGEVCIIERGGSPIDCVEIVTAKNRRYDVQHELGEDGGAGRQSYEPAGDKTSTLDSCRDSRSNFFTPVGYTVTYCNNTAAGFVPCFVVA